MKKFNPVIKVKQIATVHSIAISEKVIVTTAEAHGFTLIQYKSVKK